MPCYATLRPPYGWLPKAWFTPPTPYHPDKEEATEYVAEHVLGVPCADLAQEHGHDLLERITPTERYNV